MKILVIASAPPRANGKGHQHRLYGQLRVLARQHEVTVVAFSNGQEPEATMRSLRQICESVTLVKRNRSGGLVAGIRHSLRLPTTVAYFQDPAMFRALREATAATKYDIAHVQLIRMAPYGHVLDGIPRVLDLVDALSFNMLQRAAAAGKVARAFLRLEARRLRNYELNEMQKYEGSVLISNLDRQVLGFSAAVVSSNGVDVIDPADSGTNPRNGLVFSGNMGYFANEDAVIWFTKHVFPQVLDVAPSTTFTIVGRYPSTRVRRLGEIPNVVVAGAVPDVSEYLRSASVAVCPVRFGSGMQNKILEAMASRTPVVATPKAVGGLPAGLQDKVTTAESPEAFASQILKLLRCPEVANSVATRAFDSVRRYHTWGQSIAPLEDLYAKVVSSGASSPNEGEGRRGRRWHRRST